VRSNVMRPGAATGTPKLAPAGATAPTARSPQGARQRAAQRAKQARGGMKRPGLSLNSQRRGDRQRCRAAVAASQRHRSATAARRQRHCNATATGLSRWGGPPRADPKPSGTAATPEAPARRQVPRQADRAGRDINQINNRPRRRRTAGRNLHQAERRSLPTSATLISSRRSWSRCWSSP
jgi:hypothetical protein